MLRVLVLYASEDGQTRKIATRVAELLSKKRIDVHLRDARSSRAAAHLASFDGIVIGASVHYGHHRRELRNLVAEHSALLHTRHTAFFSVSLSAGGPTPDRDGAKRYLEEFIEETGWLPDQSAAFAGAIRHSRYSLVRTIMLRLSLLTKGMPEAGDHEYTDWHAVTAFVETFARRLDTPKR